MEPTAGRQPVGEPRRVDPAELRRSFREADEQLARALDALDEGRVTREQCLLAVVHQQREYDRYMSAILSRLGRLRR